MLLGTGFIMAVAQLISRLPMLLLLSPSYAFGQRLSFKRLSFKSTGLEMPLEMLFKMIFFKGFGIF